MADNKAAKRQKKLAKERRRAAERAEKFLSNEEKAERQAMFEKFAAMVREIREHKEAVNRHLQVDLPAYEPWFKENFPNAGSDAAQVIIEVGRLNTVLTMVEELAKAAGKKTTPFCREFAGNLPEGADFTAAVREAYAACYPEKSARILADEEKAAQFALDADKVSACDGMAKAADEFTPEQVAAVLESSKNEVFMNPAAHRPAVVDLCKKTQEKLRFNANLRRRQEASAPSWGFAALDAAGRETLKTRVAALLSQKKTALLRLAAEKRALIAKLSSQTAE